MRASNIAIAIMILSVSLSAVNEAYGVDQGVSYPIDVSALSALNQQIMDTNTGPLSAVTDFFSMAVEGLKLFFEIIKGSLMLGDTINQLVPVPLPAAFTLGLNALSTVAVALAIFQILRGITTRWAD